MAADRRRGGVVRVSVRSIGGRLVRFLVGAVLLFPLIAMAGNRGLFIPSDGWQAWSLKTGAIATGLLLLVVGLLHWLVVEQRPPTDVGSRNSRAMLRVLTAFVVIVAPVWVFGIMHGIVRGVVERPVLKQLALSATYDSYHAHRRRGHVYAYVILRSPRHGTIQINVPEISSDDLPKKGDTVILLGRRTWVGDRYDHVKLPLR